MSKTIQFLCSQLIPAVLLRKGIKMEEGDFSN